MADSANRMSYQRRFAQRVWTFLRERFPWLHMVAVFAQVAFGLKYTAVAAGSPVALDAIVERALIVPIILLVIRIADELKDFEADRVLFPERPLARGSVTLKDLNALAAICLLLIGVIAAIGFREPWTWALLFLTLAYVGLMRVWFFMPQTLKSSLPLAVLTHNPVSIPLGLFQLSIFGSPAEWPWQAWAYLLAGSLFSFAWEVGRKIRRPQDETDYVTYSRVWGARPAATVALLAMVMAFAALTAAGPRPLGVSFVPSLLLLVVAGFGGVRFILNDRRFQFSPRLVESGMLAGLMYVLIRTVV